jgi:hypothetical protein
MQGQIEAYDTNCAQNQKTGNAKFRIMSNYLISYKKKLERTAFWTRINHTVSDVTNRCARFKNPIYCIYWCLIRLVPKFWLGKRFFFKISTAKSKRILKQTFGRTGHWIRPLNAGHQLEVNTYDISTNWHQRAQLTPSPDNWVLYLNMLNILLWPNFRVSKRSPCLTSYLKQLCKMSNC